MSWRATLIAVSVAAGACSGGDAASADAGPDATPGDPNVVVGAFSVELVPPTATGAGYTSILGVVLDRPQPAAIVWDTAATAGACALLTPRVPFCDPACGAEVCVDDGVCAPYATKLSAGTVTVTGLRTEDGATEFDMEPVVNNYQLPSDVQLAYPPFDEGDELRLSAAGSEQAAPFTLHARGIAALQLAGPDPVLARDQPVELTWNAPASAGDQDVFVKLDISHHGGSRGKIECAAADAGELVIDGALITQLLELGAAGFPTIIVSRHATGAAVIAPGKVVLDVTAAVERPVVVPGVQSCTDDDECPAEQTCRDDLTCG